MEEKKDIYILAIESSCDETAAAVVKNGREVLSNVISSQIDLHTLYGGVVPEIASRKHVENIDGVIKKALADAGMTLEEMDAIGVTYGPGLVGALLVGLAEAKAIAYAAGKPLIGVHHIEGHICANYIQNKDFAPPYMALVVSGGHSHLVYVSDYGKYEIMGHTRDDAAGEAYDKVARAIGMGYPGGPKIDAAAKKGNPDAVKFPRVFLEEDSYDFSFSGLKSAENDGGRNCSGGYCGKLSAVCGRGSGEQDHQSGKGAWRKEDCAGRRGCLQQCPADKDAGGMRKEWLLSERACADSLYR